MRATCVDSIPFHTPFAADIPVNKGTVPGIVVRVHDEDIICVFEQEVKKLVSTLCQNNVRHYCFEQKGTV